MWWQMCLSLIIWLCVMLCLAKVLKKIRTNANHLNPGSIKCSEGWKKFYKKIHGVWYILVLNKSRVKIDLCYSIMDCLQYGLVCFLRLQFILSLEPVFDWQHDFLIWPSARESYCWLVLFCFSCLCSRFFFNSLKVALNSAITVPISGTSIITSG